MKIKKSQIYSERQVLELCSRTHLEGLTFKDQKNPYLIQKTRARALLQNTSLLLLHRNPSLVTFTPGSPRMMVMGQQKDKYIPKESPKCVSSTEPRQGADYFVGGVISIVWKELPEAPPENRALSWRNVVKIGANRLQIRTETRETLPKAGL